MTFLDCSQLHKTRAIKAPRGFNTAVHEFFEDFRWNCTFKYGFRCRRIWGTGLLPPLGF